MLVNHKAFIDLEKALAQKSIQSWRRLWNNFREPLTKAIRHKNWTTANALIDGLNTSALVATNAQFAHTIGMSALLLGASRLGSIHDSVVSKELPERQLKNAVLQWGYQVSRNVTQMIQRIAHKKLARMEDEAEQSRHTFKKDDSDLPDDLDDFFDSIELDGSDFLSLTASLMVSRLSSFGFLAQAQYDGIEYYQISAILDDHTCPVCEALDGTVFSVADGVALATSIMDAEDPDSLRSISPWPSQSKDSVVSLENSTVQELVDQGLALPPYHPSCRCIAVRCQSRRRHAGPPSRWASRAGSACRG